MEHEKNNNFRLSVNQCPLHFESYFPSHVFRRYNATEAANYLTALTRHPQQSRHVTFAHAIPRSLETWLPWLPVTWRKHSIRFGNFGTMRRSCKQHRRNACAEIQNLNCRTMRHKCKRFVHSAARHSKASKKKFQRTTSLKHAGTCKFMSRFTFL